MSADDLSGLAKRLREHAIVQTRSIAHISNSGKPWESTFWWEAADALDRLAAPASVDEETRARLWKSLLDDQEDKEFPDHLMVSRKEFSEILSTYATDFARRQRNAVLEESAALLIPWLDSQELRLHCGELSAQEVRTVKAVLQSRIAAIRFLKTGD